MAYDSDPNYDLDRPSAASHPTSRHAQPVQPEPPQPLAMTPAPMPDDLPDAGADAEDAFYPVVYEELKRIARHHLRANSANATLSTTELVHEAYLKISPGPTAGWDGRGHFFGAASRAMRQVLVDFARRRGATKRGGELQRVSLGNADGALDLELDSILTLDAALEKLNALDQRLRQI